MRDFAAVEENATDKGHARSDQPFSTPNLNRLPVRKGIGGIDEARRDARANADDADDEADHGAHTETKSPAELIEIQHIPAALFSPNGTFASASTHTAEGRIDDKLRPAVFAEIVSHLGLCHR